jgi:hypothetical protein
MKIVHIDEVAAPIASSIAGIFTDYRLCPFRCEPAGASVSVPVGRGLIATHPPPVTHIPRGHSAPAVVHSVYYNETCTHLGVGQGRAAGASHRAIRDRRRHTGSCGLHHRYARKDRRLPRKTLAWLTRVNVA